jgi:NADH dehydrogenase
VPQGRGGRIETDEHLRVKGMSDVFAIGDVSISPDEPLPQLAQPAIQGGKHVAKFIKAELNGKTVKPFKYKDKGTMATIGRSSAVAEIKFLPRLTGFPAWIIWVGLHVATLLGNRNRFATMINLTAKYLVWGSHNAIVGETPPVVALKPVTVEAREPRKAVSRAAARKAAVASAAKGVEALGQDPKD